MSRSKYEYAIRLLEEELRVNKEYKKQTGFYLCKPHEIDELLGAIRLLDNVGKVEKYKNNYGWCSYPFKNDPLEFCCGYACAVENGKSKKEIKKMCSKKVTKSDIRECKYLEDAGYKIGDYWCEFYKPNKEVRKNESRTI